MSNQTNIELPEGWEATKSFGDYFFRYIPAGSSGLLFRAQVQGARIRLLPCTGNTEGYHRDEYDQVLTPDKLSVCLGNISTGWQDKLRKSKAKNQVAGETMAFLEVLVARSQGNVS